MKRLVWILAALLVGAGLWWVLRGAPFIVQRETPPATAVVSRADITVRVEAIGEINPVTQVVVKPEVSGRIKRLFVHAGQSVQRDELLLMLDDTELLTERAAAETQITAARARLAKAERDLARQQALLTNDLTTRELFDNALTELDLARAEFERARQLLQTVDDRLGKIRILAPFTGTVLNVMVTEGQVVSGATSVSQGTDLMTIADLNSLLIRAHINQVDVTKLQLDQPVEVTVDAIAGLQLAGRVTFIAPVATVRNNIKGFTVDVLLAERDPRIRPGMNARLSFPVLALTNVLTVPLAAVFPDGTNRVVYVQQPTGTERRLVTLGPADYRRVQVREGVNEGDVVLLEPPRQGT
ncbi:MAG: efflux RND transporter periplasmic adaptor subunit [Verrucomicrobiae bacterium]|nr:efflux RND transporter periplasmic adaptor subunit [Verrucomicrobiae bacterium]